jgi:hypothetical protein
MAKSNVTANAALASQAKRRQTFRELHSQLTADGPLETVAACRRALARCGLNAGSGIRAGSPIRLLPGRGFRQPH